MTKKLILFFILVCISFLNQAQQETLPDPEPYFSAIIVRNFEASLNWYVDVLGFEILNQTASEEYGFSQANLKRGNVVIELIALSSSVTPEELLTNYSKKSRISGFFKIGFMVDRFYDWIKYLEEAKVEFHGKIVEDPLLNKRMIIIKDPDGNYIQIFEK